jgi:hypothetical protein
LLFSSLERPFAAGTFQTIGDAMGAAAPTGRRNIGFGQNPPL